MNETARSTRWLAAMLALCAAALGVALVSQHVFDMQPCPWCVLQRLIFSAIGVVAAAALAWRAATPRRVAAALILAGAASGIATALWQHFVAAASASCNLTLADRIMGATGLDQWLPQMYAPYASCADAAVRLLGLPYEFWSLALFVVLGAAALAVLRRPGGRSGRG